jgi:hypothetical protein
MAKIELDLIKQVLKKSAIDAGLIANILRDLQTAASQVTPADGEEKPPVVKKRYVVLLADEEGKLSGSEWMGWVVQIPEDEPMQNAAERVAKAGRAYNLTKKGRKTPVETIGEVCESVPRRIFNELKTWIKTKEPVLILPVRNSLKAFK